MRSQTDIPGAGGEAARSAYLLRELQKSGQRLDIWGSALERIGLLPDLPPEVRKIVDEALAGTAEGAQVDLTIAARPVSGGFRGFSAGGIG